MKARATRYAAPMILPLARSRGRAISKSGRRVFYCTLVAWLQVACADSGDPPALQAENAVPRTRTEAARPDLILMISLDTLRADHLGFSGYERPTSPVLDAFAARSVIFEDASATSPWTLPSHASMLTGLYPKRHGVVSHGTKLSVRTETLAGDLARAGFETYAVVNTPWLAGDTFGFMRGFETKLFVKGGGARVAPNTLVTDQALDWLGRKSTKRKFVFMHYIDAHSDYVALPEHEALFLKPFDGKFTGTTRELFELRVTDAFIESCRATPEADRCKDNMGTPLTNLLRKSVLDGDGLVHLVDRYDAGIHQLDAELGRVFDFLNEQGLMERAAVIITADHGEALMDHGDLFHAASQYQEVIRVPLLVRGPGLPEGKRVATPVSLVDLTPTILELAGVRPIIGIDGRSLVPLWRKDEKHQFDERDLFAEAPGEYNEMVGLERYHVLRRGQYKLHHELFKNRFELYDLNADPNELENIASQEPELLAAMRERLLARHPPDGEGAVDRTSDADTVDLSEEAREALRALGYLE